jgi:hypothetical protein
MKAVILLEWIRIFAPGGARNGFFWACWFFVIVDVLFYSVGCVFLNVAAVPYKRSKQPTQRIRYQYQLLSEQEY